jgi:hypothetical protein
METRIPKNIEIVGIGSPFYLPIAEIGCTFLKWAFATFDNSI